MGHQLWIVFGWPSGICTGNLLASVLWASVFEWRLRRHHRKIHLSIHGSGQEGMVSNGN